MKISDYVEMTFNLIKRLKKKKKQRDGSGVLGVVSSGLIQGWVRIPNGAPDRKITIAIDKKIIANVTGNIYRKDLKEKGIHPTGYCGFALTDFDSKLLKRGSVVEAYLEGTSIHLKNSPFVYKSEIFVFIHIPKTAGTSFRIGMDSKFQSKNVLRDYGTLYPSLSDLKSGNSSMAGNLLFLMRENGIQFFTGHFHAAKYIDTFQNNVRWCTFFRDPIQRVVSEYNHLVRHNKYSDSFKTFYRQPNQQNKQFNLTRGIDLETFYFFGLTEEYEKSIQLFNKLSGMNLPVLKLNLGKEDVNGVYDMEVGVKEELIELNSKDIELYAKAKEKFFEKLKEENIDTAKTYKDER